MRILILHGLPVIVARVSNAEFLPRLNYTHHVHSMSKTLMSMVALQPRLYGTAYMLTARKRRDFSVARNRPVREPAKTLAPSEVKIFTVASESELLPPATPQYVPLTGLELFLAENPGLKPCLLAGPARERAVTESAIAWAEICDSVCYLIRGQICLWHAGILGTLRSRMARWSGVKGLSNSKRGVETDSLVDATYSTRESPDSFITFDSPQSFVRECMPFFSVFGERFQEKSGYEIDLDDLRIKVENEKVSSTSYHLFP